MQLEKPIRLLFGIKAGKIIFELSQLGGTKSSWKPTSFTEKDLGKSEDEFNHSRKKIRFVLEN